MPKKKLSEMNQTHGRVDPPAYQTLDQMWGDTGLSEYGTLKEDEYESQLAEMNTHDLHEHAISHGVVPRDNRIQLTKTLLGEFKRHVAKHRIPSSRTPGKVNPTKEMMAILGEGR